jgi:hypothetical protein
MITAVLVALAVMLVPPAPAGPVAHEAGSVLHHVWMTAPGSINHYETPCWHRERVARGIPWDNAGYLGWYRANWGTAEWSGWNAAAAACERDHPVPKWAFDQMILVGSE